MFEGFTSRCTMPAPCAAASASAAWARSGAASSGVSAPSRRTSSARVTPSTYSITSHCCVVLRDQVEDRDDVGVVEPGGQPGLALGAAEVGAVAARHHADPLEGDLAPEHLVAAEPDGAHAAAADLAVERVPACDHCRTLPLPRPLATVTCDRPAPNPVVVRRPDAAGLSRRTRPRGPSVSIDPTLLDDLEWRGLVAHSTDLDALREALAERERPVLRRLRPDRAQPAHGQPGADPHRRAACRTPATRRTPWSAAPPA